MLLWSRATVITHPDFQTQVLAGRAVLSVEGDDAPGFLNGLVTIDASALAEERAGYGALLTPQGKILHDFFMFRTVEGFLIDCASHQRPEILQKLNTYKLRAKVTMAARDELEVGVMPEESSLPLSYQDPRMASMGYRMIAPKGTLPHGGGYDAWRISEGMADSDADIGVGKLFPHEANFDQIGGVSFTKGCYVGQEVVSRMEHRSTARSRIVPVTYDGAVPPPGTVISSGETNVGMSLSTAGSTGLALMRLDRLKDVQAPLLTHDVVTHVHIPGWLKYDTAAESE
jgi:tRNA-modifying protein YgfZ